MEMKLVNLKVSKKVWEDFIKIANAKGKNASEICRKLINNYIEQNKDILVTLKLKEYEKYNIFTNINGEFKDYEIILTNEELNKIKNHLWEEYVSDNNPNKIDFESLFEYEKPIFAVEKLVKKLFGKDFGIIRKGTGLFTLHENNNMYNNFNAFVFDENGELVEGNAYDLALIKSSEKK
jgi:flagellar hook protein FlgE